MYRRDTIAAIATAPGPGGIGIIRVSGPDAARVADQVFARRAAGSWGSHRLYHGRIVDDAGRALDDALAVLMRAPRSYTGEDVLELHCHGSPLLLQRVLSLVLQRGARPAEAGEFTKRAFLNGKLDLAQAEAVAALVAARSAGAASAAAGQLFGRLSAHLDGLRERLVHAKAQLEVRLDFSEEDLALDDTDLARELAEIATEIARLLETYARGQVLRDGLRVAITGRPNAGKSSLLNALLGMDRAIVTPQPGTTRDVLEEPADFHGVPVLLADTAGVRESDDPIEQLGIARARAAAAGADVVVVVLDAAAALAPQLPLPEVPQRIVVINKIDLPCAWPAPERNALEREHAALGISATVPLGLEALRAAVVQRAGGCWTDHLPTVTSARQHAALVQTAASIEAARTALANGIPPDLIAVDVQSALEHLGTITGAVSTEDVLDAVFREFCIGK